MIIIDKIKKDVFGEKGEERSQKKIDEIDYLIMEERKKDQFKMAEVVLFDISEKGVQTEDVRLSENEQINFLIKQLSQNEMIADAQPELIRLYTESHSMIRSSGLDIS